MRLPPIVWAAAVAVVVLVLAIVFGILYGGDPTACPSATGSTACVSGTPTATG